MIVFPIGMLCKEIGLTPEQCLKSITNDNNKNNSETKPHENLSPEEAEFLKSIGEE